MDPRPCSQCAQCNALALACAACAPGRPACPLVKWQACGVAACQRQGYSLMAQDSVDLMQTVQTSLSMLLLKGCRGWLICCMPVSLTESGASSQQTLLSSQLLDSSTCCKQEQLNKGIAVQLSMQLHRAATLNAGCLPRFS